ncbi:MAG: protein-L-isoaspartate O-methyltransferase, partial [Candidatus Micrarchaeia archaeon]
MFEDNESLVDYLKHMGYVNDKVAEGMLKYPRELFLPNEQRKYAYADLPLLIGKEQTCSAPSMVGMMLSLADIREGMNILEIGTGSAWQTAIISHIVGNDGRVVSVDIIEQFIESARRRFTELGIKNTIFLHCDGKLGAPQFAPYDRIIVSASSQNIYAPWKEQLKEGGIIILPMGPLFWQYLYKGTKKNGEIYLEQLMPVA